MNSVENSVLNLLLNPEVRSTCIHHIEGWMFDDTWASKFVSCLSQSKYDGVIIPVNEFIIDLHTQFSVSRGDCEYAASVVLNYSPPKVYDDAVFHIQEWIKQAHMTQGIEIIASGNDKDFKKRGIENITFAANFQIAVDSFYDFSDDETVAIAKEDDFPEGAHVIPSSLHMLNQALTYGGLKYGDLIAVAAGTGVGKTTFMITEGAHYTKLGYKVAHIALGDMTEYDLLIKYLSAYHYVDSDQIIADGHESYMTPEVKQWFSNLRVRSMPPDTYDIYQLLAKAQQLYQKFPYQVLFVDYDANIRESSGHGNFYLEGGTTYANLKGHGKSRCAVYVGSQTKIQFWEEELVLKHYMNDSSKKQHHLDVMIGIGKNKECPTIGKINLPKIRRGRSDVYTHVALDNSRGIIREIRKSEYDSLLHKHKIATTQGREFDTEAAQ